MRYRCLILDHDDTVMDSTRMIHYPAFLAALEEMRPTHYVSLDDYFLLNFEPGFLPYCEQTLGCTERETEREYEIWQSFVKARVPVCFEGMRKIIERQKAEGGLVCVVSHSVRDNILRDYAENGLPEPDCVFGWEQPKEMRKPSVYPVEEIRRRFGLQPEECLVIDDLKPGYDMARDAGVAFAGAGWAHRIAPIQVFMRGLPNYFETPEALAAYLEME